MKMKAIALLAGGYFLLAAAAWVFADRLIFFPSSRLISTPDDRGLPYEDVFFRAGDGTLLHGWFLPGRGKGTVLFCHGNAGNISHRLDTLEIFSGMGLSVFIFDYRGYGRSQGRPSVEGVYSDAAGAMKYLQETRRTERDEIVVFGRSLGGAVAAWTAERFSPAGLVLESTFTSLADVGRRYYFFLPVGLIVGDAFDTLGRMKGISCPVLVASSPGDEIVPGSHGEALFQAAGEPKSFLPLVGDHNSGFLLTGQAYVDGLRNFFRSVLPGFGPKE